MTTHPNPSGLTIGAWRTANGQGDTWEYFLDRTTIITESNDPADAPGIHHAIRLLSNNQILLPTYDNETEEIRTLLLKKNYRFWRERHMSIGSVVDGRWKVTGELIGATGSFNQGILFVQDQESHDNRIMKLLPTEAMLPRAAKRETDILGALDHKNIVGCYWDHVPGSTEPHGVPWMVTEYCKDGNLENLMRKWNAKQQLIPEYFVRQIFESLLSAVHYIHHGKEEVGVRVEWDSISHRDIIPSNIFLKWEVVGQAEQPSPFTVKLGDFGCAVMDSEFASDECNFNVDYLPCIDEPYAPPERRRANRGHRHMPDWPYPEYDILHGRQPSKRS
jgi:serine/threonine protein kinase